MAEFGQQGFNQINPASNPIGTGHDAQQELDHTQGDNPAPERIDKVPQKEAHLTQYPSLSGFPGIEVTERSADLPAGKATRKHRKVFVVYVGNFEFDVKSFDHAPNFTATRQYMLDHGLRPTGDVTFAGSEPVDENNLALAYEVEALPAVVATDPSTANMVVSQD